MGRFGDVETLARADAPGTRADSVEVKALLEPPAVPVAEVLTGRASPTWSERRAYLIDTAALDLLRSGVEVRLRRRARGRHDLAVSRRRCAIASRRSAPRGARVELDVVPGAWWQDVEVRREVDPDEVDAVVEGRIAPAALLSAQQLAWADAGGVTGLRLHGPLVVHRVKVAARGHGLRRADLEHLRFPGGRELLELSTRCTPRDLARTVTAFDRLLDDCGVVVAAHYRTKPAVWREDAGEGG